MSNFEPVFDTRAAANNIREFVRSHMPVFWQIMMPLIPLFVVLNVAVVVLDIFWFRDESVSSLLYQYAFTIFSLYIITMALRISWYRFIFRQKRWALQ